MALKDITTIEETEQLSADATFYTADGGAFRRAGMDAVKDALGLALESTATKEALLNCFQHVAWIDENGQEYYDALYDALYNIPVSISAIFVQGSNVIYNTDPLSTLRQYLIVRATYEDETVQTVTAYTLSGNLTVGTSTITAAYKGKTATFDVTVTQAQSYITAVYTPGTETIYTDDSLDVLKPNLVVTYYANEGAQGVIVPASDYILSGTLTAGTSTIAVNYLGNTTTFTVTGVVDWYDIYVRSIELGTAGKANGGVDPEMSDTTLYPSRLRINSPSQQNYNARRTCITGRGHACIYLNSSEEARPTDYYPIPIPLDANHIKITLLPAGQYIFMSTVPYDPVTNTYGDSVAANRLTWTQMDTTTGIVEHSIAREDEKQLFLVANFKRDSSGSAYTSATEPTAITVEFSEV